jgi:hypothetical protein
VKIRSLFNFSGYVAIAGEKFYTMGKLYLHTETNI